MKRPLLSVRQRRIAVGLLVALVVFAIVGFFVLPPIIKSQLERRLSAESGRIVTVGKVRLNPFALSLTLENFNVQEKSGPGSFVGWAKLYVDFDLLASISRQWVIRDVALDGFHANVAVNRDGSFNFSDLLALAQQPGKPAETKKTDQSSRAIRVARLAVSGARVDFSDQSRAKPFQSVVGPLTFTLQEFTTRPDRNAPYRFDAITESAEKVSWAGTLSANPLSSSGELQIENISLPKYAPYYADVLRADITDGRISIRGRYEANFTERRVMKLTDGSLQVRNLKVVEPGGQNVAVELPVLDVTAVTAGALTMQASVGAVTLAGGKIAVRRGASGSLNLLAMIAPPAAAPTGSKPVSGPPAKRPEATVGEFTLKDFQIDVVDEAAPRPAHLALQNVQVNAKNLSSMGSAAMPISVAFDWAPHGAIALNGTVAQNPIRADVALKVNGLELLPLSPYLEQTVNARITQGTINADLATTAVLNEGRPPQATVAGNFSLEKFGIVDGARNEELAGVGSVALRGIKAESGAELLVSLEEVVIADPYVRVIGNADHSLNLTELMKVPSKTANGEPAARPSAPAAPSAGPAASAPAPSGPLPKISVAKVSISGGDFTFNDRSIEPATRMSIAQFGGTISGLSSENMARADVDLKAAVDGTGPVAISGRIDPLGARKFVDLKIDLRNMDLQPFSPYSGKYAGYELARGKLVLDVKFGLDDKAINASNLITLNQFTFGAPTNSPEATKLPVRLGVALLKDLEGKIVIDVPVQGKLDDPSFQIGKVVWRVIGNLLTKAAVSPFSLLGSMFGGGGDELAFQEFVPGEADLQPGEMKKLDTMVKAFTNRPALNVDFEGNFDRAADGFALKKKKLAENVRRGIWERKHAVDPNIAPPAELVISAEEEAAMIKTMFVAKFPTGTVFDTAVPTTPTVEKPPVPPRPGVIRRVVNVITFKAQRERHAEEKETAPRAANHNQDVQAAAVDGGLPLDDMAARLAEATEISDDEFRALAERRAQQVRNYFVTIGKIAEDRLFLAQTQSGPAKFDRGPRVFLNLQ